MAILRKFTHRLFIVLNILAVLLFLLACANSFLHPGRWWVIALLGLLFPLLLLWLICFLIIGISVRTFRPWAVMSLVALLLGWSNIHSFFALHPLSHFTPEKPPHSIRVLTWNVRSFDNFISRKKTTTPHRPDSPHRPDMMDFIGSQDADVLCLEEFYEPLTRHGLESNITYIQTQLHFPYYFFSRDYGRYTGLYESGVIIFSRFPIIDTFRHDYARPDGFRATESLIAADISTGSDASTGSDTFRIFATHLQSVLFRSKEFHDIQIIKNVDDSILDASRSIALKLRTAFRHRGDQAEEVRVQLDKSPYPAIICGDFNDVPNSYAYFTIRGGWQDAFLQKGFGIGRTYINISPTLRIDYILADPQFDVLQCRKFSLPWSDHNPVVADLLLRQH
jgi:endonuclease/exonuclease/phosphatase family metal-dependent hydrolase